MFLHCKNCGKKSHFKGGYKYGFCFSNPVCKSLNARAIRTTPENKEYRKQYFSTERGKEVRKKAARKYRATEQGKAVERATKRRYRANERAKKQQQKMSLNSL